MATVAQLIRLQLFRNQQNPIPPPDPPGEMLAPSSSYNGTPGSGFGGSALAEPTDPPRTGAKCVLRSLNIPRDAFTSDHAVVYDARAFNDVAKVRISVEGSYLDVTEPRWWEYSKAGGGTDYMFGFGAVIDYDACMAASTTGTVLVCAEAYANEPGIQNRVLKEIFYPRIAGVGGADHEFDIHIEIDPKLAVDVAGVKYKNIKQALAYVITNSKMRPLFEYTRAYDAGDAATRYAGLPNGNTVSRSTAVSWATIQPAPGIGSVMVGDGSITGSYTGSQFDGIKYRSAPGTRLIIESGQCSNTGTVFRSGVSSLGAFMMDDIDFTTGTFPGGTGSGARALKFGNQWQTKWATHAGNAKMQIITRNVNAQGLSAYGIGFGLLHLNDTLNEVSGSAVENVWGGVQGMDISKVGGIPTGLRTKNLAFKLIPDPSIVNPQWEKKGPTGYGTGAPGTGSGGLAGEYGLYVYENGVQTHFMPLDGSASSSVTMVPDVVAKINAEWPNWTATAADPASILSAPHLIDASTVVSAPIGTAAKPGPNYPWGGVAKRSVPSDGLQLYTCKDIHSNVLLTSTGGNYENNLYSFLNVYDVAGSSHISLRDAMNDCYLGFATFQDRSTQYGAPGENEAQPSLINSGGTGFKKSHLVIEKISMAGPKNTLLLGPATAADDYCAVRDCAFDAGVTVHPGLTNTVTVERIVNRAILLPPNAVDSVFLTPAVPASSMYEDFSSAVPDMRPKTALVLPVGGVAGALAATETEDNHGWNL